jgi:RNA polymerase sigma-70 factor, ECF subfamily
MTTDGPVAPATLERYRSYLRLIARLHIPAGLKGKVDPSDVVQDTLVRALRGLDQFRGRTEAELAAWLRQILATTLANLARDWGRGKRDAGREVPLEQRVHDSSARLEAVLAADQSTPSQAASRNETLLQLATAIEALPDAQREAVTLYHLQQWTLDRVAEHMSRTPAAVAGLIKRGLKQIRTALADDSSTGEDR